MLVEPLSRATAITPICLANLVASTEFIADANACNCVPAAAIFRVAEEALTAASEAANVLNGVAKRKAAVPSPLTEPTSPVIAMLS
jgi:hypothetical protein